MTGDLTLKCDYAQAVHPAKHHVIQNASHVRTHCTRLIGSGSLTSPIRRWPPSQQASTRLDTETARNARHKRGPAKKMIYFFGIRTTRLFLQSSFLFIRRLNLFHFNGNPSSRLSTVGLVRVSDTSNSCRRPSIS